MESKFTHYLITRFNVKIEGYGPEFFPPGARANKWEQERLPLFEKYCVSTVAAQRSKNFKWLIYCHTATSPEIIECIRRMVNAVPSVSLFFVVDFKDMLSHIREVCSSSGTPYVITSRLDNDDGIGLDYIQVVQDHFEPRGNVVLNVLGGIIYNKANGVLTFHRHSLNNAFISLIEESNGSQEALTVYGFRHSSPPPSITVKNIEYAHAFWMTLHGSNVATRNNRGWPVWPGVHLRHYAIDPANVSISVINTLYYTFNWFPTALVKKLRFIVRSKFAANS